MATHARYSPSKLEALGTCPCFEYEESINKEAAEEGTLLHKACETEDLSICVTEEQEQLVKAALEYANSLIEEGERPPSVLKEERVEIPDVTFGIADRIHIYENLADVLDYKFGVGRVTEAKNNIQLKCYVAGTFIQYPNLLEIDGHLVLPRQGDVTKHTFVREDLDTILGEIECIVNSANDPFKKPNPEDEDLCSKCAHRGRCPAINSLAAEATQALVVQLPSSFNPEAVTAPEDRARLLAMAKILEAWVPEVKKLQVKAVLEDGIQIPHYKLVSRKGNAKITGSAAVSELCERMLGIPLLDIVGTAKLSVTALTELVAERKALSKKDARGLLESVIGDWIENGEDVVYLKKDNATEREILLNPLGLSGGSLTE